MYGDRGKLTPFDGETTIYDLLSSEAKSLNSIVAAHVKPTTWNVLMKAVSRRTLHESEFSPGRISVDFLKSMRIYEIADVRGVGEKTLEAFVEDFRNIEEINSLQESNNETLSLYECLPESYRCELFLFREQLSNTSWNVLSRYLKRNDTRYDEGAKDFIFVESLKSISWQEVSDLTNVGVIKVERLRSELGSVNSDVNRDFSPRFRQFFPKPVLFSKNELAQNLPMSTELQIMHLAIVSNDIASDLRTSFEIEELAELQLLYRNAFIFVSRFSGETLEKIANKLDLTRERVRQILEREFTKLQAYGYFANKSLNSLLQIKLNHDSNSDSVHARKVALDLENQVRAALRLSPGLTFLDLENLTGESKSWLVAHLSVGAKKFICTKEEDSLRIEDRVSDSEFISRLQVAAGIESPLTQSIYLDLVRSGVIEGPGPQSIAKRFGTWTNACEKAGIKFNESIRSHYESRWQDEQVLKAVIRFLQNNHFGRSYDDYERWRAQVDGEAPSGAKVRSLLGSWSDARCAAFKYMKSEGIKPNLQDLN